MNATQREAFLAERRRFIGGSDIAKIAGVSPYGGAINVYLEKVEGVQSEQTDVMARGNELEWPVLHAYSLSEDQEVQPCFEMRVHPDKPWAGAHLDALTLDGKRIVEAKTASNGDLWAKGVRPDYALQCQWYLGVTGLAQADVAVSIAHERTFDLLRDICRFGSVGGDEVARLIIARTDFRVIEVPRDDELIAALFETAEKFWQNHVLAKVPPPVQSTDDAKRLWPVASVGKSIEADEETYGLVLSVDGLKKAADRANKDLDQCRALIQAHMGNADELTIGGKRCATWRQQQRKGFDAKAFGEKHPDLVAEFTKTSSFRVLRMSGEKE